MTNPLFTLDGYRATIDGLIERGYAIKSFHDAQADQPHLILRHDIDQSIPRASLLAEHEASQGWHAAYFVLLRTEMYNAWSRENTARLRAMCGMGHELGLHLDATYYTSGEFENGAATECRHLEDITGKTVRLISFHRPAPERLGGNTRIAGRLHTYMDRFTKQMGYSSDSRGEWHHGHPWEHAAVCDKRALQLLTHAVWWTGKNAEKPIEALANVHREISEGLDREMSDNNDVWARSAKGSA